MVVSRDNGLITEPGQAVRAFLFVQLSLPAPVNAHGGSRPVDIIRLSACARADRACSSPRPAQRSALESLGEPWTTASRASRSRPRCGEEPRAYNRVMRLVPCNLPPMSRRPGRCSPGQVGVQLNNLTSRSLSVDGQHSRSTAPHQLRSISRMHHSSPRTSYSSTNAEDVGS